MKAASEVGVRAWLRQRIDAQLRRYVEVASRHAVLLTLLFLGLGAATALPLSRLGLRTDLAALLPDQHPAVVALRRIEGRMRSMLYMFVALRGPDAAANRRCLQALTPELERLTPATFSEVQLRPRRDVPDFIWRNRWLYAPLAELERADALVERAIAKRTQPMLVDLEDDDPEAALRKLRSELEGRLPAAPASLPTYFEATADGEHYMAAVLWRPLSGIGTASDRDAVQRVKELIGRARTGAAGLSACGSSVRLELGGQLVISQEEQDALREDLTIATALCALLVMLAIYLHFRRPLLVLLVGAPAVLAVLLAMSVASFTVQALNVNSAFLLSIILGNGINPAIIVLSRYGEERGRGAAVEPALSQALAVTLGGTGAAMAAASIAYGCLALTSFRGFSQFGLIGGVGMLLSFACTLLVLPPLLILGERLSPGLLTPRPSLYRRLFVPLGALLPRRPRLLAAVSLLVALLAAGALWRYAADPLEWDFTKLRAQATPGQRVEARLNEVGLGNLGLGYVGTNGVLRVDDESEAEPVAAELRRRAQAVPEQRLVRVVRTLRSFLPEQQEQKLVILGRLRARLDRHRELLGQEDLRALEQVAPPPELRQLTVEDLPLSARLAFTEVDGHRGRLIGIDYDPRHDDWDGHQMLRMAELLTFSAAGKSWVVAGAATVFGGMLDAILHDAPRVTLAALAGVSALIVLLFGVREAIPTLLALALGVLWMGGAAALVGLKINYMNFVALPITLGIGTDYAVNIWSRWRRSDGTLAAEAPARRMAAVIAETGAAVTLCSLTTIIGYSSLLLAGNRALRSFGLMADLGEICCLLAALVALPALVRMPK